MAVSPAVRRYYAERILARTTRDSVPPNFRPLDAPYTGRSVVEGCRGGGKNILEIRIVVRDDRLADLQLICGLCNPAMHIAADVVAHWARGRGLEAILALDPLRIADLGPFFEALGGPGRPDDAREKFQYTLWAMQNAVRDHQGKPPLPRPVIDEPRERDWDDPDPDTP